MSVEHGGTDSGPAPRVDASTNANPYGPSPMAIAALDAAVGPYPDPTAATTRRALASHHGIPQDDVVVGAGATELIDRLVRVVGGPVLVEGVTFGEYAGAAARHGVEVRTATRDGFSRTLDDVALAFVCSPGNPDGEVRDQTWTDEVAAAAADTGTTLVWDLAYAPLVPDPVPAPSTAVALHAPNKAHGCTGLRAGWLRAPADLAGRLRDAAVTWVVSAPGLAFLEATATAAGDRWVAEHRQRLLGDTDALVAGLVGLGVDVHVGEAPFVLVRVPAPWSGRDLAAALRADHGVKVRPTDSMGRPGWVRVAAVPAPDRELLLDAFASTLTRSAP